MKHQGGRGIKAGENKYERFSVSVPPDVFEALNRYAEQKGVNRSEALTLMVQRHEKVWPTKKRV